MLKDEIEQLQGKLNDAIDKNQDSKIIYDLSTQLDLLIVSYYRELGLSVS